MHVRFTPAALSKALQVVAPFASKDTARPLLNCIRMELLTDGAILFASTDGHRLALYRVKPHDVVSAKKRTSVCYSLAHVATLLAVLKPFTKGETKPPRVVDLKTVHGTAAVRVDGSEPVLAECTFRPLDEALRFPPIRRVVPAKAGTAANVALNPKFAADAFAAFERAIDGRLVHGVVAFTSGELDPVVFRCPDVPGLTIITMPVRQTTAASWVELAPAVADAPVEGEAA